MTSPDQTTVEVTASHTENIVHLSAIPDEDTLHVAAIPTNGQTVELPIAVLVRAMRRTHDDRATLRRIATFYMAVGCCVLLGALGIGVLEAAGVNAIYVPTPESQTTTFNAQSILPPSSVGSWTRTDPAFDTSGMSESDVSIEPATASGAEATQSEPAIETPIPTPVPIVIPDPPAIVAVMMPTIGVDAGVVVRSVDADGVMQTPGEPWAVAWYDFSSNPINPGNAVFSGHVDYIDIGPAVFWRLGELVEGDEIVVSLDDGTAMSYRVTAMTVVPAETDAETLNGIIGPTETPSITFITCTGGFDPTALHYDQRLIVRAERT